MDDNKIYDINIKIDDTFIKIDFDLSITRFEYINITNS